MFKKYLTTIFATVTTLNGFSALLVVSGLVVCNPLLTSPARAEPLDYSRGIQFLSSQKDVLNKIVTQVWEQCGWMVSRAITDELLTGTHVNTYFPPDVIYDRSVIKGQLEPNVSIKSYPDGSAARFDFTIKNNTIQFKVRNKDRNINPFPFDRASIPAEVIVNYDLNISLKIKANSQISLGSDLYLTAPFSTFKINVLNSTNTETTRKIKNILFGDIGLNFFKATRDRLNSDIYTKKYVTTKIQEAIEQNVPKDLLQQTNRKSRVFRGQQPSIDPIEDPYNSRPNN